MKKPKSGTGIIKSKRNKHGRIELREDNILVFRPELSSFKNYDMQVLTDLLIDFREITNGTPRPYLVDNRHVSGLISRQEKAYINKHFGEFATQCAMLTHSNAVSVLLNGYNFIFKPKVKIKLFQEEKDAVQWLLEGDQ